MPSNEVIAMPTTLPRRPPPRPDLFIFFLLALTAAFFVVEIVDPAPVEVEAAAMVTSP